MPDRHFFGFLTRKPVVVPDPSATIPGMIPSRLRSDSSTIIISGARLSVHKLAKELQIDRSYLNRVLRGERDCSRTYARMIAARLHISVDDLLKQIETLNQTTSQTTDQTTEATRETLGY